MPQYVELDDFEISAPNQNLCLSVSSHLFVSDSTNLQMDCHSLYDCVKAERLWFLPPSTFYLQLRLRIGDREMHTVPPESNFLEYCANTVCLATLWDQLGLSISCTEVHYETDCDGDPNLFFEIEQPDKSFALLSPPHAQTSTVHGLTCSLDYDWISNSPNDENIVDDSDSMDIEEHAERPENLVYHEEGNSSNATETADQPMIIDPYEHYIDEELGRDAGTDENHRRIIVQLAVAALHKIIGTKKRFLGIRLGQPITPTLLELAPCVCNANYIQTVATYANQFSAIADIITDAQTWRPSLQDKIAKLSRGQVNNPEESLPSDHKNTRSAVRQKLWSLLHTSVDCNAGMRNALSRVDQTSRQLEMQESESLLFSEDMFDQSDDYEMEDPLEAVHNPEWRPSDSNYHSEWETASQYNLADTPVNMVTDFYPESDFRTDDPVVFSEQSADSQEHGQIDNAMQMGQGLWHTDYQICNEERRADLFQVEYYGYEQGERQEEDTHFERDSMSHRHETGYSVGRLSGQSMWE